MTIDDAPVTSQLPTLASRIEARPPALWPSSIGWRAELRRWLSRSRSRLPWPVAPRDPLVDARTDFLDSLADLDDGGDGVHGLHRAIARSRSLRELWHLRLPVHQAVSQALGESEALRRSAWLNRHFSLRAAGTGRARSPCRPPDDACGDARDDAPR